MAIIALCKGSSSEDTSLTVPSTKSGMYKSVPVTTPGEYVFNLKTPHI
jgi:hypothetical protein